MIARRILPGVLALTAWLFFYKSRGEISLQVLSKEARIFAERWERFFQELSEKDPDFYYDHFAGEAGDIFAGFRLLEDSDLCPTLVTFQHTCDKNLVLCDE